jgi:hypothetical protein
MLNAIRTNALIRIIGLRSYWQVKRRDLQTPTDEAIELAIRLEDFFAAEPSADTILIQPPFKGCGIIDSCYGDVLQGDHLFELKMVDRNLRSIDLRQVLVYCALNHNSQQYLIKTVSVLNPRRALEYRFDLNELVLQIANKTPAELFHQITDFAYNFESLHHVH